jgi:hypothetical protein
MPSCLLLSRVHNLHIRTLHCNACSPKYAPRRKTGGPLGTPRAYRHARCVLAHQSAHHWYRNADYGDVALDCQPNPHLITRPGYIIDVDSDGPGHDKGSDYGGDGRAKYVSLMFLEARLQPYKIPMHMRNPRISLSRRGNKSFIMRGVGIRTTWMSVKILIIVPIISRVFSSEQSFPSTPVQ